MSESAKDAAHAGLVRLQAGAEGTGKYGMYRVSHTSTHSQSPFPSKMH